MSSVLITGGLGNLGSWITQHFINRGYRVSVLTKNKREVAIEGDYELIFADIANYENLAQKLENRYFDYIIHTASVNEGFVPNYFELAALVNVLGTRNLLEVFKNSIPKNFIYFSTFQVYGKYNGTITEETETLPQHDYGTTHLQAELSVKQLHKTHKMPYTIFRLSNSYGAPKDLDSSKWYLVLNDLSKSAFIDKKIVLKSNGLAPRDFIWMGTVANIVEKACEIETTNDTYNISGESTITMLDVANYVQQAYEEKYGEKIPVVTNLEDKTIYPDDLDVRSDKLRKIIEVNDQISFISEAKKIFQLLESKK